MDSDYIHQVPLTKWLLAKCNDEPSRFPGVGKTAYKEILLGVHNYLNNHVHPTVQNRGELKDSGIYLTDHGPKHIEQVIRRASYLVRTAECVRNEGAMDNEYCPCIEPYEAFLLVMAIHFHDVGNMYGRKGHETQIGEVMEKIPVLQSLPWPERTAIQQIALCHGGKIEGEKDTIQTLQTGYACNGEVRYRLQLLAAILRLADELADDYTRADQFGLLEKENLPPTCLIFHKYAESLKVSMDLIAGQVRLYFQLHGPDLTAQFQKVVQDGAITNVYLLDEIYERTLKTYSETLYCGRYMRGLETSLHEVRVEIDIFENKKHAFPLRKYTYTIGNSGYPDLHSKTSKSLRKLGRGFKDLPTGAKLAQELTNLQPAK